MTNRARHAFGSETNIDSALAAGTIDAYDILFLNEKKIGWIDKNGNKVIVEGEQYVVNIDDETLPTTGKEGIIYIFNDECYIWNGDEFVSLNQDLTSLENEIANKVDEETVDDKIQTAIDSLSVDVVEF